MNSGSTFLVIGEGFSRCDISVDMAGLLSTSAVYFPIKEPPLDPPHNSKIQYRGQVTEFLTIGGNTGRIRYEDMSEDGINSCILATGYKVAFPFLFDSLVQTNTDAAGTERRTVPFPSLSTYSRPLASTRPPR